MGISRIVRRDFPTLSPQDTLLEAARKLQKCKVNELPVVERGKLAGVFSISDLAAALVKESILGKTAPADVSRARSGLVGQHMSRAPRWLWEDADVASAMAFFIHHHGDCIPVLDRKGKVVGAVLADDVRGQMVAILAGEKRVKKGGAAGEAPAAGATPIDQLLHYIQARGSATAEEVAKQFRLPLEEVEEYALSLEKHGLLRLEYSILGKMKIMKKE
ncbi:MAG: CBS domain-containing protein [Candidatus Micrarchaeota archaeon]|nr:CBS domain-containing protein [Candidatus Micrarchaeota archaeon]